MQVGVALALSESHGYSLSFRAEPSCGRPVWPSESGEPIMMLHLDRDVDDRDGAVAPAAVVGA